MSELDNRTMLNCRPNRARENLTRWCRTNWEITSIVTNINNIRCHILSAMRALH